MAGADFTGADFAVDLEDACPACGAASSWSAELFSAGGLLEQEVTVRTANRAARMRSLMMLSRRNTELPAHQRGLSADCDDAILGQEKEVRKIKCAVWLTRQAG